MLVEGWGKRGLSGKISSLPIFRRGSGGCWKEEGLKWRMVKGELYIYIYIYLLSVIMVEMRGGEIENGAILRRLQIIARVLSIFSYILMMKVYENFFIRPFPTV